MSDDLQPSPESPAHPITTPLGWGDLVLDPPTRAEAEAILAWIRRAEPAHGWDLAGPGFRAHFHGPSGTGKTLTAALLGKATGRPVYRVDLSRVLAEETDVTEKALADLFENARNRGWILFFDEAGKLFERRTESRHANDRAANQQVAYLLQRLEDFPGLILLATDLLSHLDEAFARRLQAVLHFRRAEAG